MNFKYIGEEVDWMMAYKLTAAAVIVLFSAIAINEASAQKVTKGESLRRGETRATLAPSFFKDGRVRAAYQAAKEIPWVLDSIYCYCQCEESPAFRHKSLLSCYVDNHAAM
jgi:hypothetical protein